MENEILSGQRSSWSLVKKLGEGDAGEVYLVESLMGDRVGVLKRPQKSAFTGEMIRQAGQIKKEGNILQALAASNPNGLKGKLRVPELLDLSKADDEFGDHMFIVTEHASGLDLSFLSRVSHLGLTEEEAASPIYALLESSLLASISQEGHIPNRILLSCLSAILDVFQQIHSKTDIFDGEPAQGLIYNDVKPEHIFWNAAEDAVTLIDWGNAQSLYEGGASRDRRYSLLDDFRQFVEGMGKYLLASAPDLRSWLNWPVYFDPEEDLYARGGLADRIQEALKAEENRLVETKSRQEAFLRPAYANPDGLLGIKHIEKELLSLGKLPDYEGIHVFLNGYATRLVIDGDLLGLQEVCDWAAQLPGDQRTHWKLVNRLATISMRSEGTLRQQFLDIIQAAICSQAENVVWKLAVALEDLPEPNWWQDLMSQVRRLDTGNESEDLLPFIAVNRLGLSLQALIREQEDKLNRLQRQTATAPAGDPADSENQKRFSFLQSCYHSLFEDILGNWPLLDPIPPYAWLDYADIDLLLKNLEAVLPNEVKQVDQVLTPARAQVNRVLDAWERRDFVAACQGLRPLMLMDPNRKRVIRVDQMILSTPDWLNKVHLGPRQIEKFQEFATDLEFEGRELRNHMGAAGWLDSILNCLANMRKGIWPSDLLNQEPSLGKELPWLKLFEREESLPQEIKEEEHKAKVENAAAFPVYWGTHEGVFGPKGELHLVEPMDAWLPEARGSSARVYLVEDGEAKGKTAAIKFMRMDKVDYSLPLFSEEVKILKIMDQVPGVNRMLECGFILQEPAGSLPFDSDIQGIRGLKGKLFRIGMDSTQVFLDQLNDRVKENWMPYLILEKQEQEDCLLYHCDAGITHGEFLPMVNLLQTAIQVCDIIEEAHKRNIVYRDHKILHYYWKKQTNGVYLIDWNVARYHPEGLSDYERHLDLVQFGARGLHHILTGRSAPGALPLGPTRPEDIEQAAETYHAQWTYDDERLSAHLRNIIEGVLAGKYHEISALRNDLKGSFITL